MRNKPITLGKAVDLYFESDRMKRKAAGTQGQHRRTLNALIRVCGPGRSVTLMTAEDFSRTIELLRHPADDIELAATRLARGNRGVRRGRSEWSLNIDRSVLRTFVRFLHVAEHLTRAHDPAAGLESEPKARVQGHKRQPMLRDAVLALMDLAGEYHPRERIAVALATLAGLRESEILELRWRDVIWRSPDGPMLDYKRPKRRNDSHRIILNPTLERELRAWHAYYSARHPEMYPSWFVVPAKKYGHLPGGKTGQGMTQEWPLVPDRRSTRRFQSIIKPMMAQVGVTDLHGKGMHTLRRTFANVLLEDTENIRVVQNALGHRSQLTTEVYLDRDRDFEVATAAMRHWDPFVKLYGQGGNVIPLRRAGGER